MGNKRGEGRATCTVEPCAGDVKGRGLCEKHYMRARRHNGDTTVGEGRYGEGYTMTSGYVLRGIKGHPLAGAKNQVYAHRVVLFAKIGPGRHPCHWCGRLLTWRRGRVRSDSLIADHVDGDPANNVPDNLVPSCNRCNTTRGKAPAHAR